MKREQAIAEIEMVRAKLTLMGHMDNNRDKALGMAIDSLSQSGMNVFALNRTLNVVAEQDAKLVTLYKLTGMDIDELIALFAKGYTLEPPKPSTESLADYAQ